MGARISGGREWRRVLNGSQPSGGSCERMYSRRPDLDQQILAADVRLEIDDPRVCPGAPTERRGRTIFPSARGA